jgi:hypothetical protein
MLYAHLTQGHSKDRPWFGRGLGIILVLGMQRSAEVDMISQDPSHGATSISNETTFAFTINQPLSSETMHPGRFVYATATQ